VNHLDSRSPEWLDTDEPLPLAVLDAIRVADLEDGTPEQVTSLEARLGPLFQAPHAVVSEPGTSAPASTSFGALKLGALGAALVGLAALVWPAPRQLPGPQPAAPSQPAIADAPAPLVASLPQVAPEPALAPVSPDADAASTAPAATKPARRHGASVSSGRRLGDNEDTLALEARLLSRARAVMESDPAQALQLAEQHSARFPSGALSEEREAIAIKALRRLGKEEPAARRQARFLARYPESPHALSLRSGSAPR